MTRPYFAKDLTAIILAAGDGNRMKSQTPKPLHKVCGKEILNMILDAIELSGIAYSVTIVPSDYKLFEISAGNRTRFEVQGQAKGTGHALLQAKKAAKNSRFILVLNGDIPLISPETISRLISLHQEKESTATFLTNRKDNPLGSGRVIRTHNGAVEAIVEERDADSKIKDVTEVNCGVYCFEAPWVWSALESLKPSSTNEFYITDLIALALEQNLRVETLETVREEETINVNDRIQLAEAEAFLQQNIRAKWMKSGVTLVDPTSIYIEQGVDIGKDTSVLPNTHIQQGSIIGRNCQIGPDSTVKASTIGDKSKVTHSVIENASLGTEVSVGPFSHIRAGTVLENNVYVGNHVEIKNSTLGAESKCGHFSYIGDAIIGTNVNLGAGTITCNYDGLTKHTTVIGNNAFIGSNTMLVAPVNIGENAVTGTGSIVNKNVPEGARAIGAPVRIIVGERS